jgi:hypothetical protein
MAVSTKIDYTMAAILADAITALIDTGTGAIINIYDNTAAVPADCEAGNGANVLLATILMGATAFGAAADQTPNARIGAIGVPLSDTDADATGTAAYFRVYTTTGTQNDAGKVKCWIQGTVGTATSDLIMDSVNIAAGGTATINTYYITIPESFT